MKKEGPKPQDLRLIYETNDLFSTYKPVVIPEIEKERLPSLPLPPAPKPVITQQPPPIQFLDPLPIKITGIIASSNEAKSQVSIMNNNTNKTDSYTMGDKLFDAYIIRIFPRKIVIHTIKWPTRNALYVFIGCSRGIKKSSRCFMG